MSTKLSLFALAVIFLIHSASAITVELPERGTPFCFLKHLDKNERFIGSYVISGDDETGVVAVVKSPGEYKILFESEEEREGYWDVKIDQTGEYSVCFKSTDGGSNYLSLVLYGETEIDRLVNSTQLTANSIDEFGYSLNETFVHLREITDNLHFQRIRETVHFDILESLDSKITWSVFFKVLSLIAIAAAQAYILTGFFKSKARNFV